jgi:hypothetical protein
LASVDFCAFARNQRHDASFVEEEVGDGDGGAHLAAGAVAQVEDERLGVLALQSVERRFDFARGVVAEAEDADVADAAVVIEEIVVPALGIAARAADRRCDDDLAPDRQRDQFAVAADGDLDGRVGRATQPGEDRVHRHAFERAAVDGDEVVAAPRACFAGGGADRQIGEERQLGVVVDSERDADAGEARLKSERNSFHSSASRYCEYGSRFLSRSRSARSSISAPSMGRMNSFSMAARTASNFETCCC